MGEKRGMKALEAWCRKVTDGYRDVAILNMSSSWRDGLAFCAIIHHFRPDLIDYDSLNKENIQYNNELAFTVAEKTLGIPSLLDAEDMVKYSVPDKLSILTYVSQFYQFFESNGNQARSPVKTTMRSVESPKSSSSSPGSPSGKVPTCSPTSRRPDVCHNCNNRVYILERLIIDNKLYHRTCFKCCRCGSVLKPAAYVDGPSSGQYECTSCPDEEEAEKAALASMASSRLMQQNALANKAKWELPVVVRQPRDIKSISSPSAEARKLFLSSSMSGVTATDGSVVIDNGDESGKPKQFSSVSSYLFGPNVVDSAAMESGTNVDIETKENASSASEKDGVGSHRRDSERVEGMDVPGNGGQSLLESSSTDSNLCDSLYVSANDENEKREAKGESWDLASQSESELVVAGQIDATPTQRPVPSPRRLRKKDVLVAEKSSEEVFTTPETSPRARLRTKTPDSDVAARVMPEIPVRRIFHPRAVEENTASKVETSCDKPALPSRSGKVVLDMPVIRPQVHRAMLSPPKIGERMSSSVGETDVDTFAKADNESKESLDTTDGSKIEVRIEALESKESLESTNGSKTEVRIGALDSNESNESLNKRDDSKTEVRTEVSDSNELEAVAVATSELVVVNKNGSTELRLEERKTPPPRPQLPLALAKTPPLQKKTETADSENSETNVVKYPEDLNPFNDEEEEEKDDQSRELTLKKEKSGPSSLNPFDESEEEFEDAVNSEEILTSTPRIKPSESPKGLNPFDEDDDEEEIETPKSSERPVPSPRTILTDTSPVATPRREFHSASSSPAHSWSKATGQRQLPSTSSSPAVSPPNSLSRVSGQRYSFQESSYNISPTGSVSTGRKKRPAPRPPAARSLFAPETPVRTHTLSPSHYHKKSPAPLPPPLRNDQSGDTINEKMLKDLGNISLKTKEARASLSPDASGANDNDLSDSSRYHTFGYWKKKKKPAPPIPLPPKRQTVRLNMKEIEMELAEIEKKQLDLEQQGVDLEKTIRERLTDDNTDSGNGEEENELIIQLFELVNQKNVLFRRQSELVYMKRQQRLEEEHAELEYQIRCLMGRTETTKTKDQMDEEEILINRLVEVVKQRNEIIESIETDRLREAAEDKTIQEQFAIHQAGSSRSSLNSQGSSTSMENVGKKEKAKKNKGKKIKGGESTPKEKENAKVHDEDKDVDDVESGLSEKKKKKNKRNSWF